MPGNQHHIPDAVKEEWVRMSTCIGSGEIAQVTGASQHTVNQVLHLSHLTGSVTKKPLKCGCPCLLTAHDAHYLVACVECTPNIYTCELQHLLQESRGIKLSESTIECTLHRHGFSHKCVCMSKQ
ncbi:hypothetical protein F5J12DRAFT_728309 [Pisolithus orientalis]|uniref:uncharacterized protein n=1 Tax=Pisolithus orientalis TaxID=936130 RepID=UPI0022258F7C|nr:uncharacterized protein F5J12DRAFT_728309 [Pisolithus orientalis]KAI5987948.1 hypothetical protein F5J12DRAFT_728309 [Pisolithus orientalis]